MQGNTSALRERVKVPGKPGIWRRKNADGRVVYEIAYRDSDGKFRRHVPEEGDGSLKAAEAALGKVKAKRGDGERVAPKAKLTFNEAADAWWEARVLKLRPATQRAYLSNLIHLRARFGRRRLADITPTDVARFVSEQQAAGLKGWTIRGRVNSLNGVFTYAARHLGFGGVNPVGLLDRVERPSTEDERPKRILSSDELARLLVAVDEPYRIMFELAAETGGRLGEVLGAIWREVDLDAATVTYAHQLDRNGQRVALKTARSRRCIEITPVLAAKLRRLKLASPRSGPHDLVFVTTAGTPHDHRNIGGRVLGRAVKRAGLEAVEREGETLEHAPTFHSFRHSHASALIAQGWDIEEVSRRLGHANVATTMRIYVNEYDAARRSDDRRDRLARLYAMTAAVTATDRSEAQQAPSAASAEVVDLQGKHAVGQ